jgi:hypothetical protein
MLFIPERSCAKIEYLRKTAGISPQFFKIIAAHPLTLIAQNTYQSVGVDEDIDPYGLCGALAPYLNGSS